MVVSAKNGSIVAVTGSGIRHMSDSFIAFQPAIDEPSNIRPSANVSSSHMPPSKLTFCHFPRGSVNRKSTYLTSLSLMDFRTSLAVFMIPLLATGPRDPAAAAPRGKCSIASGAVQDNIAVPPTPAIACSFSKVRGLQDRADRQIASNPDSPVRLRMASSLLETK